MREQVCTWVCMIAGCIVILGAAVVVSGTLISWGVEKWADLTRFGSLVYKHAWNAAWKEAYGRYPDESSDASKSGYTIPGTHIERNDLSEGAP